MPAVSRAFRSYALSVPEVLDAAGAGALLADYPRILIKPNLVNASPFPVTTPVECCATLIRYLRDHNPAAEIVVAEGCGDAVRETPEVFRALGYTQMAKDCGVELVDLNRAPLVERCDLEAEVLKRVLLPALLFSHAVISLPVLKAHPLAGMTGAMKNMVGCAPPGILAGPTGSWKKAGLHRRLHESIRDLCRHIRPLFCLVDASVGLADYHLGGPVCSPPLNTLLAGTDLRAVDRAGAELLGIDLRAVAHLSDTKV